MPLETAEALKARIEGERTRMAREWMDDAIHALHMAGGAALRDDTKRDCENMRNTLALIRSRI